MVQSAIALADGEPVAPAAPARITEVGDELVKLFGSVSDGRSGQGRDHPVAAVLALAALGVASPAADRPAPPTWPATCADTGRLSRCTGCATPCTRKIKPRSEPDPGPGSWPRSGTWPFAPCACPDAPMSPKPPDGPAGQWTGHSPSSVSLHDLETAVLTRAAKISWLARHCEGRRATRCCWLSTSCRLLCPGLRSHCQV